MIQNKVKRLFFYIKRVFLVRRLGKSYPLCKVDTCICQNTSFHKISEQDRYGIPVGASICDNCGLVFLTPRICDDFLSTFYERDYRKLYGSKDASDEAYLSRSLRRGESIVSFLSGKNITESVDKVAVEIGCGVGGILRVIQNKGWSAVGCDYDADCIESAKESGINAFVGGIEELIDRKIKADLIILSHVLEHLPDPVDFLQNVKRILSRDGVIYLEVPGLLNSKVNFFKSIQVAHLYYFDLDNLVRILRKQAFKWIMEMNRLRFLQRNHMGNSLDR